MLSEDSDKYTVCVGGTSTITADFLHDSNGVYHNPAGGVVPYTGYEKFKTTNGTIKNVKFINGKATSILTKLRKVAIFSATVDNLTLKKTVTVERRTVN